MDISKAMHSITEALPPRPPQAADQATAVARFESLFARNSRAVLGYALRRTDRPEDAADVLSEVMLTAWRRIDAVPAEPEDRLWLYGVARRTLSNQRRTHKRRHRLGDLLRTALADTVGEDLAETHARQAAVRDALRCLPEADREVLLLQAWEGLDSEQIAAVMDLTTATVRSRTFRARERLRIALDEQEAR